VTLPKVATNQLVKKFDEFSLYNNAADFEFGSASNSNSTTTWVEPCELALEPSRGLVLPHEQIPYDLPKLKEQVQTRKTKRMKCLRPEKQKGHYADEDNQKEGVGGSKMIRNYSWRLIPFVRKMLGGACHV
jgi:hypothetical protein